MTRRQFSNTATGATLTGGIAAADTSFTLTSFSGYPPVPFTATISRGQTDEEVILVTAVSSATVTVTRGYDGTTAKSHAAGASFTHTTVAKDFDEANLHINSSTGVHGLAGAVVGTTDTQTLSGKTLSSPSILSPTITGTTNIGSATLSGSITVTGSANLSSASASGTLSVTGATTLAALTVNGAATFNSTVTVTTPTLAGHATRKDYVDAADTALGNRVTTNEGVLNAATNAATANVLAKRDASGRLQVAAPSSAGDATPKSYVDTADSALSSRVSTLETGTSGTLTLNGLYAATAAGGGTPKWRRLANDMAIQGGITAGVGWVSANVAQWYQVATLPASTSPAQDLFFSTQYATGSAYAIGWVAVRATGVVEVLFTSTPSSNFTIGLSGVNWRIGV